MIAIVDGHTIDNPWFESGAYVPTIAVEALTAVETRPPYKRQKRRNLFDLWMAVEHAGVLPTEIPVYFEPDRPDGRTVSRTLADLEAKLEDRQFATTRDPPITDWPQGRSTAAGASELLLGAIERRPR